MEDILKKIDTLIKEISEFSTDKKVSAINSVKEMLHSISPFKEEPVDCVLWVNSEAVVANDYNPNSVAPPEMELLRVSIGTDGYTQPIVTCYEDEIYTVVDGFHRHRVGKECPDINARISNYLPVVKINDSSNDRGNKIAATIRHNRARGKHKVDAMSDIILELKKRNWSDTKIGKQLGMEPDEVLRLYQISGLTETFKDREFSQAWEGIEE